MQISLIFCWHFYDAFRIRRGRGGGGYCVSYRAHYRYRSYSLDSLCEEICVPRDVCTAVPGFWPAIMGPGCGTIRNGFVISTQHTNIYTPNPLTPCENANGSGAVFALPYAADAQCPVFKSSRSSVRGCCGEQQQPRP